MIILLLASVAAFTSCKKDQSATSLLSSSELPQKNYDLCR